MIERARQSGLFPCRRRRFKLSRMWLPYAGSRSKSDGVPWLANLPHRDMEIFRYLLSTIRNLIGSRTEFVALNPTYARPSFMVKKAAPGSFAKEVLSLMVAVALVCNDFYKADAQRRNNKAYILTGL